MFKTFFPSTSSNYVCSRQAGGSVSALYDDPEINMVLRQFFDAGLIPASVVTPGLKDLMDLVWFGPVDDMSNTRIGYSNRKIKEAYVKLYSYVYLKALEEPNLVEGVALQEALKVRVITKSPPFRTFVLKPLQKALHDRLRRHPTFKLVGQSISTRMLDETFSSYMQHPQYRHLKFLSGDYKDATNQLQSCFSEAVAREIVQNCGLYGTNLHSLFIESLTRHTYDLKNIEEYQWMFGDQEKLNQLNGQLMGSITSFIVLCLVNAGLCAFCIERGSSIRGSLCDLPLLINGDDCLFLATANVHELWKSAGQIAGLLPSIGKYFLSNEIVQINSMNFRRVLPYVYYYAEKGSQDSDWPSMKPYVSFFRKIPVSSMGLVYGNPRSTSIEVPEDFKLVTLSSRQKDFLSDCPRELRAEHNHFFWQENFRLIKNSGLPWYMPCELGGLGLEPDALVAKRDRPSSEMRGHMDKVICQAIIEGEEFGTLPLPRLCKVDSSWMTHGLVNDLLEEAGITLGFYDYERLTFSRFYETATIASLFMAPLESHLRDTDLSFAERNERLLEDYKIALKRNQYFWRCAHKRSVMLRKIFSEHEPGFWTNWSAPETIHRHCPVVDLDDFYRPLKQDFDIMRTQSNRRRMLNLIIPRNLDFGEISY